VTAIGKTFASPSHTLTNTQRTLTKTRNLNCHVFLSPSH